MAKRKTKLSKRSNKLSRKKSKKGGMQKSSVKKGLVDMSFLQHKGKLLDLDKIKQLYEDSFDYLRGLDGAQMDEIKEFVDKQEVDDKKLELLNSIFKNYNPPFNPGDQPTPPIPDFDFEEETDCLMGFKNIKTLGQGAAGVTFLVEKDGKQYALKQQSIKTEEWSPPKKKQINIIKNEILISQEMGEKNIGPKIYDSYICEEDGVIKINILMEYMNEGTLKEWYEKNPFTEEHKKNIKSKITALHDEEVFHRDVHLENIFVNVDESGKPQFYLGDFGLARTLGGLIHITKELDFQTFNAGIAMVENDKYIKMIAKLFIINGLV